MVTTDQEAAWVGLLVYVAEQVELNVDGKVSYYFLFEEVSFFFLFFARGQIWAPTRTHVLQNVFYFM